VLYRWFCGLRFDDPPPDDSTLAVYRRRLGEEKFRDLFRKVIEQARAKNLIRGDWTIVDGTKLVADAAVRNCLNLAREVRKKLLSLVEKEDKAKAKELREYKEPLKDSEYPARSELLAAETARSNELLEELSALERSEELSKAEEVCAQALSKSSGAASLSDPEARWGFKNKRDSFFGYKVDAACDGQGIVTAVEVGPGNESEPAYLENILVAVKKAGLDVKRVAADKGYDGCAVRKRLMRAQIRRYIPRRSESIEKRIAPFRYEQVKGLPKIACPCGAANLSCTPHKAGGFTVYWSVSACKACGQREACIGSRTRKVMYINPPLERKTSPKMKIAMRIRKAVERVFGNGKKWCEMGRARYRGRGRAAIQVLVTMVLLNAKKSVSILCPAAG
jgi:IS5 family transposase